MLERFGSQDAIKAYYNAAAPHLQALFCHRTLGTKVKINRVGEFEFLDERIDCGAWSSMSISTF